MEENNPLISITVITYNSSKFVLETLESIKAQTYQNIELIVSDDCSKDNTVEVCREWIENNKERFVNTHLITTPVNTGISANINRALAVCKGEWIKGIAGDDALYPDSIEKVIEFLSRHQNIDLLLTQIEIFNESFEGKNSVGIKPNNWQNNSIYSDNVTAQKQLEYILKGGFFYTPGFFIRKTIYTAFGVYDEKYNLNEDIPFYTKIFLNKKHINFTPIVTVKYRKHIHNLTSINNKIIPTYLNQTNATLLKASVKYGRIVFIVNSAWNWFFCKAILLLGNKGIFLTALNKFRLFFRPVRVLNLFKKMTRN